MKTEPRQKITTEKNQSQTNRTFETINNVNKTEHSERTTPGQSDISTLNNGRKSAIADNENMNRENFYHWGATSETMANIRLRNNSPETRRLVEQRNALSRPGTLRRRYDHQKPKNNIRAVPTSKRSREEIAEIDAELMRRANRLGGGYQPKQEEPEDNPEEGELEQEQEHKEEDSVILRADNLPIVDLNKYNADRKEAKYFEINHIEKSDSKQKDHRRKHQEGGI